MHVTGAQVQTDGPGVQVSPVVVTVPSGATLAPPEQVAPSAWQVRGAGQSAAVLHACTLGLQVPVVLVCGGGVGHFVSAGQVGAMVGIGSITQSKSALGQSATLVQTMGLGSQTPVVGMGTGSGVGTGVGGKGLTSGAAPASVAGTGGLLGGVAVVAQLVPAGQGFATLPPAPPVPSPALPVAAPVPMLVAPPSGATPAVPGVALTTPLPVLPVPDTAYPRTH